MDDVVKRSWLGLVRNATAAATVLMVVHGGVPATAGAATFLVNSSVDAVDAAPGDGLCADAAGNCTLRAAIMEANALFGSDSITLPGGTYALTATGGNEDAAVSGDLDLTADVTIQGAGPTSTIIDGNQSDRVFHILAGSAAISGVTIRNGFPPHTPFSVGGGILLRSATLTLTDSVIRANMVGNGFGGAISIQSATATIINSTISGNSAGTVGGAISNGMGSLTLINSTISGNSAANGGGGIYNDLSATLSLTNCTLSNNSGGALSNVGGATAALVNTIVANSSNGTNCNVPAGGLVSNGHNLSSDASCAFAAAGDLNSSNPLLGLLALNAPGTTETHALLSGSPAIGGGDNAACPATDQRGVARPQGATCDIGAYEAVAAPTATHTSTFGRLPTATLTATPIPPILSSCAGDCDGDGMVTVNEIILMVNIALGTLPISACISGDANQDGMIDITDIITAISHAIFGCPCAFVGPRMCGGTCPNPTDVCVPRPDDSGCVCQSQQPSLTPTPTGTPFFRPTPSATPTTSSPSVTATVTPSVTLTATPTAACITPPAGMVAWWTADNTANDLSGNGNHGALQGAASYTAGTVGAAFSLPTIADYVQFPNSATLNFGANLSIDAWIRTTNPTAGRATIVDKRTGSNTNPVGYTFFIFSGLLGFQLSDGQPFLNHVAAAPLINDGNWHHVAVSVDRTSTSGGRLYADGVLIHTFDPTTRPGSIVNSAPLRLGVGVIGAPQTFENFQGAIDEVEIFDRALTASEVQAVFAAGAGGKCKTPLPTRTATASVTRTPTRSATPTRTGTSTPTLRPTNTPTRTGTASFTHTPRATATPTRSATASPTVTLTRTATASLTITGTPTITGTHTATRTRTATFTITRTPTITSTRSMTPTSTRTPTSGCPGAVCTATPTITATLGAGSNITILKNTDPDGPQDFTFTATGGLMPSPFFLDDDADPTLANAQTFSNVPPGTYTFSEILPPGWMITSIGCSGGGSFSTGVASATVTVGAGANVTCTFKNVLRPTPTITPTPTASRPPTPTATRTPTRTPNFPPVE